MLRLMSTRSVVTSLPSTTIPGRDEHAAAPVRHVLVGVVADVGIIERSPASQQHAPLADLLVARQGLVEEVEQVVVQRHDLLHELDVLHQADQVVGEELDGGNGADAARDRASRDGRAGLPSGRTSRASCGSLQRFAVELAGEGVERGHDVGDGAIAVVAGVRRRRRLRLVPDLGIGLLDHLLAEIDADQVVLEDVVVEHVLGGFAEVDDPLGDRRAA